MTTFACRTRDSAGAVLERTIDADSKDDAISKLQSSGLIPIAVNELAGAGAERSRAAGRAVGRRVRPRSLLQFTIQLGSSISAGVPILTAIASIRDQTHDAGLRETLTRICSDVAGGLSLSDAMELHPRVFSDVYVNSVRAGEESGTLDQILGDLAEYLEADLEVRADVRSALLYPSIVITTLILAVSVLIVFVVPRFATFYSGFKTELPLPTRILIAVSTAVSEYFAYFVVGLVLFGIAIVKLASTRVGRSVVDRMVLRIPIVGRLIETSITLRVMQMLGLFTRAGVPILDGLRTIARTISNTRIRGELGAAAEAVTTGSSLSAGLEAAACFPPAVRQMIATGESTGSLERACFTVASQFKKELRYLTKNLATFIEPVLTLVLAVVVLFVALATFLPMWDLVKVVRH